MSKEDDEDTGSRVVRPTPQGTPVQTEEVDDDESQGEIEGEDAIEDDDVEKYLYVAKPMTMKQASAEKTRGKGDEEGRMMRDFEKVLREQRRAEKEEKRNGNGADCSDGREAKRKNMGG